MWLVIPAIALSVAVVLVRRSRRLSLVRMRSAWGRPVHRARRMDAVAATHAARVAGSTGVRSLDERTWTDLNLDQVFAAIDRTTSTLGQHALYHRLRTAPVADRLDAFEALVRRMTLDEAARERAQLSLARLQDPQGYDVWELANADAIGPRSWYRVFPLLTAVAIVLSVLAPFWSAAVIPLLAVLLVNVVIRYATDFYIGSVARRFRQCAPLIATAASLRFLEGRDIDPIVGPLRTDVQPLARLKLISRWTNGDPFMLSVDADPLAAAFNDIVAAVYEYLNLAFLLDASGVYFAAGDLARHQESLRRITAAAGDVDAAIAIASFRAGRTDWVQPDFRATGTTIELNELRHPLVEDAVPNSIVLKPGRGVLITRSNMSGKSTFLRTVGVNAVLAQTVGTCVAGSYGAPIFDVRSCIGRSDDLMAGKSYYVVEVETLLALVRASGEPSPHLFLLDELFRGTNAVERIAAGQAVLLELLRASTGAAIPHVVLATTHDSELVELACEAYDAYHFADAVGADGPTFDHVLQPGPSATRNAIALLRVHGAPETLLAQALTTADLLDRHLLGVRPPASR